MSAKTDLAIALSRLAEANYDAEVVAHAQRSLEGQQLHPLVSEQWLRRACAFARRAGPKGQPGLRFAHGTQLLRHVYHLHEGDFPRHLFGRWGDGRIVLLVLSSALDGDATMYHGERVIDVATLVPALTASCILEHLP